MERYMVYSIFERLWHWTQAGLVISLLITGFEVHGTYTNLGYEAATHLHGNLAWALIGLWILAIFWHFTTGAWKHYIPTTKNLLDVMIYYGGGIFEGKEHPYKKKIHAKHNPLQRLAYLGLKLGISPVIWISGLLYMFYNDWQQFGLDGMLTLEYVAMAHTAAAFAMLVFLIGHVYMAFTCRPVYAHLKAMITGYDDH
ncbi:cytochrome B561 [Magnetococcus marinus MC-1]|uniref:Cytochrome B561 n=1 Tax=Magnetococcus marinus (strain ATCC BAA-1437 / JCM 17883 / MC-1) TaxID=156889 RepID=A0L604_MAGMM|nr:cytochrome B561 [Magnetococcus marinus MC-1]